MKIQTKMNLLRYLIYCKSKNNEIAIETILYISADGKKLRILGVGKSIPKEPYEKINVFPKNNSSKTFELI